MSAAALPQNHADDMLVAVGESSDIFISDPQKAIEDDPNVQSLEEFLLEAIGKLAPPSEDDVRFDYSEDAAPNSTWLGARAVTFSAPICDDDTKKRKWTLIVRYKNLKGKRSQVKVAPFYVDLKADTSTSARCAARARARFVSHLLNETFGMTETTWQIKPNESLLSLETKEVAKINVRVEKLEQHVFAENSSLNSWTRVNVESYEDAHSIPSTNHSLTQQVCSNWYQCCCGAGYDNLFYRSHTGKKCKDGSYDLRTLDNHGRCKQCGGSQPIAAPQGTLKECCREAVKSGWYQQHAGPRCNDQTYDMHFKENKGRCKQCGVAAKVELCYEYTMTTSCAPASTGRTVPTNGAYKCCCNAGGSNDARYRSHKGQKCKDGSYNMRCKENKTRCKQCG